MGLHCPAFVSHVDPDQLSCLTHHPLVTVGVFFPFPQRPQPGVASLFGFGGAQDMACQVCILNLSLRWAVELSSPSGTDGVAPLPLHTQALRAS